MKRKQYKWLLSELDIWQEKGIVDYTTKEKIKTHYESEKINDDIKLGDILGVLGIILIGLGIVLILAKNWRYFPRIVKLIISMLPFVCGSIGGIVVLQKPRAPWLKEGIAIFITIGIIIGLVMNGQVYHVVEDEWMISIKLVVLSLPLIYLYQSTLTLGVYLAAGSLGIFNTTLVGRGFIGLVIIGAIAPFVIKRYKEARCSMMTSWGNGFVGVAGFLYLTAMLQDTTIFYEIYILYFIGLIILDNLLYEEHMPLVIRPFSVVGNIGLYITLFVLTFNDERRQMAHGIRAEFEIALMLLLLAGVIVSVVGLIKMKRGFSKKIVVYVVGATFIIGCQILSLVFTNSNIVLVILTNILFALLAMIILREGILYNNMGGINRGLMLLGALILARFFDSDIPFLIKGLVFICCGIVLLAVNLYMIKRQKEALAHHENK